MTRYFIHLKAMSKLINDFKKMVLDTYFRYGNPPSIHSEPIEPYYCFTPKYKQYCQPLSDIVSICDMFEISTLDENKELMIAETICLVDPNAISTRSNFEDSLKLIAEVFKAAEKRLQDKIALLSREEYLRLDEALTCYLQGCYRSTVAMSVSAIEFRLFSLMKAKCPNAPLEELTLGQLIREYLTNREKYGEIIPKKHEPLLNHCNTYRVFSVHPKQETISKSIATSILYMTFSFCLDEKLKP